MKKASEREKRAAKLSTLDAKLLSFSYSASGVSWNRFCNVWLLKSGFSPREVGLMKSLSLVGKFVAQPVWAGTADAGSPPAVLAASVAASVLTLEGLRLGTRDGYNAHALAAAAGGAARAFPHQALRTVALLRVLSPLVLSCSSSNNNNNIVGTRHALVLCGTPQRCHVSDAIALGCRRCHRCIADGGRGGTYCCTLREGA